MSNLETIHGDEEAIEHCSDAWYEALCEHATGEYGEIDWETAQHAVQHTHQQLSAEYGYGLEEILRGLDDAVATIKDRDIQISYL